ncbi:MAG TPA: hypothetical protein VGF75_02515 [Candidatus Saccharimonadales bacterium]|jgi:hypothetical protein
MQITSLDAPELQWANITVVPNFFPLDLLCELNHSVNEQPDRKRMLTTGEGTPFPEPLNRAAILASKLICGINTAITKRYEPGVESQAFAMHFDPQEYQGGILLCSLGNFATLRVFDPYVGDIDVPCDTNTAVAMRADRQHSITPPLNLGSRNFLFFGHECQEITAGDVKAPIPYMDVYAGLGDLFDIGF